MANHPVHSVGCGTVTSGHAQPRFMYRDRDATWAAFVATRLPATVTFAQLDPANCWESGQCNPAVCVLLADDVAAPDVLYRCVRHLSDDAYALILVAQRSADPALSAMLCEAGAHAVLRSMGALIMWVPAIRKWLRAELP